MQDEAYDLVIAGAGIVGISCALWAQNSGFKVLICDANPVGSQTTYGSACTIATYACLPINSPSIIRNLPHLLTSSESPLAINYRYALGNLGWMTKFLAACRPRRVEEITYALSRLLSQADAGLDPLIKAAGAEDLLVSNDCLYVWSTKRAYEAAKPGNDLRRAAGVAFEDIGADEVRALEPELRMDIHRGILFKGARHVLNPQSLAERFLAKFQSLGGKILPSHVAEVKARPNGVDIHLKNGLKIDAPKVLIAAGAHSKSIIGAGVRELPLGVERGYHITFAQEGRRVSRPVGWAEAGLYATPMGLGLRLAGTVELDAIDKPPNPARLAYLQRKSQQMFGAMGEPQQKWLGFRPTMPDALPVIGPCKHSDRILYAFGHQHIGLTLAGMTGQIVTQVLRSEPASINLAPYSPKRF